MAFVIPNLKGAQDETFLKKRKEIKTMKDNYLTRDYKILLYLNFPWNFPYTPGELFKEDCQEENLFLLLTVFNNALKTLLTIPLIIYGRLLFVFTSLMLTFSIFLLFSLSICWSLFRKRSCIITAMKMLLSVSKEVNPRKFKSKWNVYLFLSLNICGFLVFSTTCGLTP